MLVSLIVYLATLPYHWHSKEKGTLTGLDVLMDRQMDYVMHSNGWMNR